MTTNTKRDIKQQYERDLQLIQQLSDNEQIMLYQGKVKQLVMIIDRLSRDLASAKEHEKNAYNALTTLDIEMCQRPFNLDTPLTKEEKEKNILLRELGQQYDAALYTVSKIQQTQSELKKMLKMLKELNVKECPVSQKYVIADWTFRLFNNELPQNEYLELSKHIHGSPNPHMQALSIALVTLVTLLSFATMITCIALFPPVGLPVAGMIAGEICGILTPVFGGMYCAFGFDNDGMAKEITDIGRQFRLFKPEYAQCNTSSTITHAINSIPAQIINENIYII